MVLTRLAEQGPAWISAGGSRHQVRDALPSCPKHEVGRGKGAGCKGKHCPSSSVAHLWPPRHTTSVLWHGVFPRRAVESLPGLASLPRWGACHQNRLFCWKEGVGRAPQSDGWSGPFPLQAAWRAGREPGKGFLMRQYNASLLSIVAGHN